MYRKTNNNTTNKPTNTMPRNSGSNIYSGSYEYGAQQMTMKPQQRSTNLSNSINGSTAVKQTSSFQAYGTTDRRYGNQQAQQPGGDTVTGATSSTSNARKAGQGGVGRNTLQTNASLIMKQKTSATSSQSTIGGKPSVGASPHATPTHGSNKQPTSHDSTNADTFWKRNNPVFNRDNNRASAQPSSQADFYQSQAPPGLISEKTKPRVQPRGQESFQRLKTDNNNILRQQDRSSNASGHQQRERVNQRLQKIRNDAGESPIQTLTHKQNIMHTNNPPNSSSFAPGLQSSDRSTNNNNISSQQQQQSSVHSSTQSGLHQPRANSNNDIRSQFDNIDIRSPVDIRKPGRLVSTGLEATSSPVNNPSAQRTSMMDSLSYPFLGLQNRKFYTCFMNSILQCILATPNLANSLVSLKQNPVLNRRSSYQGKVSTQLIEFLNTYLNAKTSQQGSSTQSLDLALRRFHKSFSEVFAQFQSYEQQDVHEFLSCLFLSLNEDINTAPKFDQPPDSRLLNTDQSKVNKSEYFRSCKKALEERDKSLITEMFQGIVGDCILCQTCKKPKVRYETELILSLPLGDAANSQQRTFSRGSQNRTRSLAAAGSIPQKRRENMNRVTFDECLEKFFELEVLPDTELLTCDYCKKKRQVSKQTEIYSLPNILVIHLKRFVFSERHMDFAKIDDIVEIKPVLQVPCAGDSSVGTYKLYGMVHHFGTKSNGHYISQVLDNVGGQDQWYTCDDERISRLNGTPEFDSSTAYVLFYTKIDQASASRQRQRKVAHL